MTDTDVQAGEVPPGQTWESLYEAYWAELVRLGHLLTGSLSVGEDLAQEAFVGLLRHGPVVQNPRAYLRRSIINLAANDRRRVQRERRHWSMQEAPISLPQDVDEMWSKLRSLSSRQRAVLVLRYYEDLTENDIAALLGCRPGTVKSLAARALGRLRKELEAT